MSDEQRPPLRRVTVRTRHVESEGGSCAVSVATCPRSDDPVALERCEGCVHTERIEQSRSGRAVAVHCRPPPPSRPELTRKPSLLGCAMEAVLQQTLVTEVMTTDVTCVEPSLGLERLTELFLTLRFSGAPVVTPEGRPVGMVSKTDLVREAYEAAIDPEEGTPRTVADVMSERPTCVQDTAHLGEVAALMALEGLHRVPVLGRDGRVCGIVSALDVARWVARQAGYVVPTGGPAEPPAPEELLAR